MKITKDEVLKLLYAMESLKVDEATLDLSDKDFDDYHEYYELNTIDFDIYKNGHFVHTALTLKA